MFNYIKCCLEKLVQPKKNTRDWRNIGHGVMRRKREQKISWAATQGQKTLNKYEEEWICLCRKCEAGLRVAEAIVLDNDNNGLYSKEPKAMI